MKIIKQLLVAVALLLCCVTANAYDFEVDGIYYTITSTSYLTVDVAPSPLNSYQGNIVIPKYVTYDSKTYTVTGIENEAFNGNKYIYSVVMPQSITDIGMCAFWGCSNLSKITVSENIVRIGVGAFHQTAWFNNKSAGVVYIGKVLYGYKGTMPANTSITVKEGTIGIAEGAFMNNKNLKSITFPNSLIIIGGDAFGGTTWYNNQPNGAIYAGKVFYGYKSSTATISVNIKDGTLGIADCAFNSCSSILSSVTIPNSVTYIGEGAFNNCNLLTSITIPDKVTTIEAETFQNCSNITSVTISANVAKIKKSAFLGCTKLTSVNISNLSAWLKIDFQSDYSNPLYYAKKLYLNGSLVTDLIVPDSFKQINAYSFRNCTSLKSILIPNSITDIETSAFEGCTELKTVINCSDLPLMPGIIGYGNVSTYADWVRTVPQGVVEGDFIFGIKNGEYRLCIYIGNDKSLTLPYKYKEGNYAIGDIAFAYCKNIESIIIPDCVTSIEDEAFKGCSGLTSITIPNSVTRIGDETFMGTGWYKNQPDGLLYLDGWLLGYKSLQPTGALTINEGTKGIADNAFFNCTGLTSVTIPNSVTSIGGSAFFYCRELTSVTIGNSVTSIGNCAFKDCTGLASIYLLGETPSSIGDDNFTKSQYADITLYVPTGAIETYRNADTWKNFQNIQEFDATGINDVNASSVAIEVTDNGISLSDAEGAKVDIYTLNGMLVKKIENYTDEEIFLNNGVYLVCVNGNTIKIKL